jgi:hypothetical protein
MRLPLPATGLRLNADNRNDLSQDTPLYGQTRQGLLAANSENEGRWIWSGALRPRRTGSMGACRGMESSLGSDTNRSSALSCYGVGKKSFVRELGRANDISAALVGRSVQAISPHRRVAHARHPRTRDDWWRGWRADQAGVRRLRSPHRPPRGYELRGGRLVEDTRVASRGSPLSVKIWRALVEGCGGTRLLRSRRRPVARPSATVRLQRDGLPPGSEARVARARQARLAQETLWSRLQ